MTEAFCLKERTRHEMNGVSEFRMKNGRRALQGTCSSCGTRLFKILGKMDANAGPSTTAPSLQTAQQAY